MGPDLSEWYIGPSQGRDSDILTQSNFATSLFMLGGEQDGTVEVHRFGHWACGWFEQILVHESAIDQLKKLDDIAEALTDYPVLDDDDYYQREADQQKEDLEQYYDDFVENITKTVGSKFMSTVNEKYLKRFIEDMYSEQCSYCGIEDAYLTDDRTELLRIVTDLYYGKNVNPLGTIQRRFMIHLAT